MIRLRLRSGRQRKHEMGGFAYGSPPFGWRSENGELVEVPDEQTTLSYMQAERARGASYREICTFLTNMERKTRRGGEWFPANVAKILGRAEGEK